MPIPQGKIPQVMGCIIRVSLLDDDGTPSAGLSSYATDCLSKLTVTPTYTAGQEIKESNACGVSYIDFKAPDALTNAAVSLDLLAPDPILTTLLCPSTKKLNVASGVDGWAYPPIGALTGQCAIEIWAQRINNGVLDPVYPYARWLLPFVNNMQLGAREFSNTAQHSLFDGQAYESENFFDGPLNDWTHTSDRVAQWIPTATIPDGTTGAAATVTAS